MLTEDPALDSRRVVLGLSGRAVAQDDIEHTEQADNSIETVFAILARTEAIQDLGPRSTELLLRTARSPWVEVTAVSAPTGSWLPTGVTGLQAATGTAPGANPR